MSQDKVDVGATATLELVSYSNGGGVSTNDGQHQRPRLLVPNVRATRARARRSTESVLLQDLGESLPLSQRTLRSLDKISILRLAVMELKLRQLFGLTRARRSSSSSSATGGEDFALEELIANGFLIVMTATGDVIYVSEAITDCLGLNSWEVMGKSIYDFALPEDRADVDQLLAMEYENGTYSSVSHRTGLVRLKCTLRPPDNPIYFRPASNKVIYFTGKLYLNSPVVPTTVSEVNGSPCFIGVGRTIPHPSDHDYPFPTILGRTFISLLSSKNLAFVQVDSGLEGLTGFSPRELVNTKGFDMVHAEDAIGMAHRFKSLYDKGQTQFEPHRLLVKGGGWVWMIADASTVYTNSYRANSQRANKSSQVVCRCSALSGVESKDIVSANQLPAVGNSSTSNNTSEDESSDLELLHSTSSTVLVPVPVSTSTLHDPLTTTASDTSLLEELLRSEPTSSSVPIPISDLGIDWLDNVSELNQYVTQPEPSMLAVKEEEITESSSDPFLDLTALTGDIDFSTLPAFTQALDALFVEEPPVYSPPMSESSGYISEDAGAGHVRGRRWTLQDSFVEADPTNFTSIGQRRNQNGDDSSPGSQDDYKKIKVEQSHWD